MTLENTMTMGELAGPGRDVKLSRAYDRFARAFDAPQWETLPAGVRQAVVAASAQVDHEADSDRLLTVEQVAAEINVSVDLIYRMLKGGELAGKRIGKLWRIRESAMWKWLDRSVETMERKVVKLRA